MRRVAVVTAGGASWLALVLVPRLALACSYAIPAPFEIDPAQVGVDVSPPVLSAVRVSELVRGIPNGDPAGSCGPTSSTIGFQVDASDDLTLPESLGYRVEVLRGFAPLHYDEPIAYMYYGWSDDPAAALDFELRVRVIDKAGNESNPVDIHVTDGLDPDEGGCSLPSTASDALTPAWLWMLGLGCYLRRRRRSPSRSGAGGRR